MHADKVYDAFELLESNFRRQVDEIPVGAVAGR